MWYNLNISCSRRHVVSWSLLSLRDVIVVILPRPLISLFLCYEEEEESIDCSNVKNMSMGMLKLAITSLLFLMFFFSCNAKCILGLWSSRPTEQTLINTTTQEQYRTKRTNEPKKRSTTIN